MLWVWLAFLICLYAIDCTLVLSQLYALIAERGSHWLDLTMISHTHQNYRLDNFPRIKNFFKLHQPFSSIPHIGLNLKVATLQWNDAHRYLVHSRRSHWNVQLFFGVPQQLPELVLGKLLEKFKQKHFSSIAESGGLEPSPCYPLSSGWSFQPLIST